MNNGDPLDNAQVQRPLSRKAHIRIILIFSLVIIATAVMLVFARGAIRPVLIGCFLALLMKSMCNVIERRLTLISERKKPITPKKHKLIAFASIAMTYVAWAGIIILFLVIVVPRVGIALNTIISRLPAFMNDLYQFALSLVDEGGIFSDYSENIIEIVNKSWNEWYNTELQPTISKLAGIMINGISGMFSLIFDIFVGAIISAYLLAERKKLAAQLKLVIYAMCGEGLGNTVIDELKFANKMFSGYFIGHLIDSALVGAVCYLAMLALRLPYAVLVSVIVGVTNMIPFFGPYIGAIPSAIIIMTVSPWKALIFFVMAMLLQQIDGNIICPKIVGSNTGLSSFWVLFSILLFTGLFGFVGTLIGVPIFAVVYDIAKKLIFHCLEKRGQQHEVKKYRETYSGDGNGTKDIRSPKDNNIGGTNDIDGADSTKAANNT